MQHTYQYLHIRQFLARHRIITRTPRAVCPKRKNYLADGDEVVPEGLGTRAREGRELAHQRPSRGSAHEDWSKNAGVDGGSVPRGESGGGGSRPVPLYSDNGNDAN